MSGILDLVTVVVKCEGFTNNGVGVRNCADKSADDARTKGCVRVNMITICANKTKARVASWQVIIVIMVIT